MSAPTCMVAGTLYAAAPSAPAKPFAADIARTALRQPSGVDVDALVQPMVPVQTGSPSLQDQVTALPWQPVMLCQVLGCLLLRVQEQLASLLASEQRFVEAVQSREVPAAANLAVEVLKVRGGLPWMPVCCVAISDSCAAAALQAQIESSAGLHEDNRLPSMSGFGIFLAEEGSSCLTASLLRASPGCRVSDRWGTGSLEDRAANSPGEQNLPPQASRWSLTL